MIEQDGTGATILQPPANDDKEAWRAYWKKQGQPWRSEPEINAERQKYLAERCSIKPDWEQGIYPFKGIELSRADVEWLLATHESGGMRGPVDGCDERQRERQGLDLRGASLRALNLACLPLARLRAGLTHEERGLVNREQRLMAATHLEYANLSQAHLEEAVLGRAHLEHANLELAHLELADLGGAHLEGTYLKEAHLEGAYLRRAFFDIYSDLNGVILGGEQLGSVSVVDVNWNSVNLAVVQWSPSTMLGDECKARQRKMPDGKVKEKATRLQEYEKAVRANRQLAVALQTQGLNEVATRFAYRAQKLQRVVLRWQRKFGQYLFYLFLDVLAGYGYRPGRSVFWYLVIIFGFAMAYLVFGHIPPFPDAFVFSIMSFHGRGFFPSLSGETSLHNPSVVLAAFEAIVGLLIEISFISTFTQRFFGK